MQLYNNINRRLETFNPTDKNNVKVYLCGPTVYNYIHVGNARGPVVFDVLIKLLKKEFDKVTYVRNITDVDDKINAKAKEAGVDISVISKKYTDIYRKNMDDLGVSRPDVEPLATEHIEEMITMINDLINNGHAYVKKEQENNHVLFSVSSFKEYGKLSGRSLSDMRITEKMTNADYKDNNGDFVLWKPSSDDQPGWNSPWGRGRPGWHIECSAMSKKHLGDEIDIHGGGIDLQFPHHENEIAQSCCANKKDTFSKFWIHNGMLNFDGGKMSKSVGNIVLLDDVLKKYPGEVIRYALLSAHYRQPLEWSEDLLIQSYKTINKVYSLLAGIEDKYEPKESQEFLDALNDDINTPMAFSIISKLVNDIKKTDNAEEKSKIKSMIIGSGRILGIYQENPNLWLANKTMIGDDINGKDVEALLEERAEAKKSKDFKRADEIRSRLDEIGILVEDTLSGSRWSKKPF